MILTLIIVFLCLIGLMVIHEFGHFILAKKFGVLVEEFGIGYPPRIFARKIGETVYSLNLLPFGAFVKVKGEIEKIEDPRSFSSQPAAKRALIALGGVISFWIMASIILTVVLMMGAPSIVSDEDNYNLKNVKVQIAEVVSSSPAQKAGLEIGDTIIKIKNPNFKFQNINKVGEAQEFLQENKGEEVFLTIQRGKDVFEVSLTPRISPPEGEGPIGVALVRTAVKKYPWYIAPAKGVLATGRLTAAIFQGYYEAIKNAVQGLPTGVQLMGPVGVLHILTQASSLGLSYFLNLLALIAIYLAIFNILPIPAADGGKLLFLGIEAARKKPISQNIEQKITAVFFLSLVILAIFVTIKDIGRLLK